MRHRGDEGSATLELVILAPVLLVVAVIMIYFGRIESAQGDVQSAARAGVQAAVVQVGASAAQSSASTAVANTLGTDHVACPAPIVATDVADFAAGGWVTVTVTCQTSLADVTVPGVPGSKRFVATSTAPIDPYRSITSGPVP